MFQVADWGTRKREIADAFRQATPLPAEADEGAYEAVFAQIGIASAQDMMILISFVDDVIMGARREERPTTPLDSFLAWLRHKQIYEA